SSRGWASDPSARPSMCPRKCALLVSTEVETAVRQITIRHGDARGAIGPLPEPLRIIIVDDSYLVRIARFPWLRRCQSVRQRQLSDRWHRVQPTNHPTRRQKTAAVRWRL